MLEHKLEIVPAFDKRNSDPSRNYGIHGAEFRFYAIGPAGVIQFVIYSNWHLPHVHRELLNKCNPGREYGRFCSLEPMAADIGYHSPVAMYEGQTPLTDSCPLLNGRKCFYDGSGLNAQRYFDIMVSEGHESLWKSLDEYYYERFGTVDMPTANSGAGTAYNTGRSARNANC
jgi:hypothetical protein